MGVDELNPSSLSKNPDTVLCLKENRFFYSDYVSAVLSRQTLDKLEHLAGKAPAGFLSVRMVDFYGFAASNGEKEGLTLLKRLQERTAFYFRTVLAGCSFLALDSRGINNILISFLPADDAVSFPGSELLEKFRFRLETDINREMFWNDGRRIIVQTGIAVIPFDSERFYKALFKAYCDARQTARHQQDDPDAPPAVRRLHESADTQQTGCTASICSLVYKGLTVTPENTVQMVKKQIEFGGAFKNSVVVIRDGIPQGIIMNYHLDRKLSTRYGISLYYHRPVARLMNPDPLIVDINASVEDAAKAAMERPESTLYDDIIVTEGGRYAGTVSVQGMLDHLAENQVKIAMGANPLTRLPGNIVIEQVIEQRIQNCQPSSLIYIDLDNFKVYNDAYGFENGDRMILFAAQVIKSAACEKAREEAFVGHVGGDDFVVISDQEEAEAIAAAVIDAFERDVAQHYSPAHRESGYIMGKGRDGIERRYPFVSVSIGILDCEFKHAFTMDELSHRVAEIKKYAKSKKGSSYIRDRRPPIGGEPNNG